MFIRSWGIAVPKQNGKLCPLSGVWLTIGASLSCIATAEVPQIRSDERIVVVGSRASVPRIGDDTSVPVDVLTAEDIARTGFTETGRIIQSLVPSFNVSVSTVSDGSDTVRPATLRGLWPDQVLVLINGKRRHNSALVHVNGTIGRGTSGTDFNAIPPSAIARIEVLRDGAAAQYGSDAIAGVINIVLKDDASDDEAGVWYGQTYRGDGEQLRAMFSGHVDLTADGYLRLTAERRNRNHTDRAGDDRYRVGDAESDNDYVFMNSELRLPNDATAYLFGGASQRESRSPGFFRLPICTTDEDPASDGCTATSARSNNNIYPQGFLPFIEPEVDDESLVAGVRGELGGWHWDASLGYGRNRFDFTITNSLNVTLGDDSPTQAYAGGFEFEQTTWNFDLVRSLDLFGNPMTFAVGAEYRVEDYELHAGEPASYRDGGESEVPDIPNVPAPPGIQVFPGFQPRNEVSEDRESYAGYFDIEADLGERLRLGVALRYEDFTDFGASLTGKLTGRFDLSDAFAVRGAVSTGFRAPSLSQQYFNSISTQFINGVAFETTTLRSDDPLLRTAGVEELKEEESMHYSVGIVTRPLEDLTLVIDAYYVDIDDRITLSSQYSRGIFSDGDPVRTALDDRGIGRFQFFTNAVDTYTRGIDVVADYLLDLDDSAALRLSAAMNVGSTQASNDVNEPSGLAATGNSVFDRRERIWLEDGQPHQHYTLGADYSRGDYAFSMRASRYGSVRSTEADDTPAQRYDAEWITDIALHRDWPQGFRWTIGAHNVFNVYPERNDPQAVSNANIFTYNRRVSPFGINGGYYYTGLMYRF